MPWMLMVADEERTALQSQAGATSPMVLEFKVGDAKGWRPGFVRVDVPSKCKVRARRKTSVRVAQQMA
jgi:hypothetical protein